MGVRAGRFWSTLHSSRNKQRRPYLKRWKEKPDPESCSDFHKCITQMYYSKHPAMLVHAHGHAHALTCVHTKPHHHIEISSHPIDNRMAIIKKTKVDKCWGGNRDRELLCTVDRDVR